MTYSPLRARVSATFILRVSARKPTPRPSARTVEMMITSFSRPWYLQKKEEKGCTRMCENDERSRSICGAVCHWWYVPIDGVEFKLAVKPSLSSKSLEEH